MDLVSNCESCTVRARDLVNGSKKLDSYLILDFLPNKALEAKKYLTPDIGYPIGFDLGVACTREGRWAIGTTQTLSDRMVGADSVACYNAQHSAPLNDPVIFALALSKEYDPIFPGRSSDILDFYLDQNKRLESQGIEPLDDMLYALAQPNPIKHQKPFLIKLFTLRDLIPRAKVFSH